MQSLAVVAMAVEEDTTVVSNTHPLNDVAQQSTGGSDVQTDPQQTESNNLEQGDSGTELSKSIEGVVEHIATGSHEQQVGMAEHARARSSHTPTFCKSLNYLRDVIMKDTETSLPVCDVELRLKHVDPGLEFVDLQNATSIQGPAGTTPTGEFGEDDKNTTKQDG